MRQVLFSFVGETPQVVTETLFCLLKEYGIEGGEVHLLTTSKKEIKDSAFGLVEKKGWIKRFNDHYGTDWKACNNPDFAWAGNMNGVQVLEAEDIYNKNDNINAIDAITRIIYHWTKQDVVFHVSLAGGRKQLASYMYQALSWFGKPGRFGEPGRTYFHHVILSKELENSKSVNGWESGYFPKPGSGESSVDKAKNASHGYYVQLVRQPIIYLQHFLPNFFVGKASNFDIPYLDNEYQSTMKLFPFANHNPYNFLTFANLVKRAQFLRGLTQDSPDQVEIKILPGNEKNFIVTTNKLSRSIKIEENQLSLLYFLYRLDDYESNINLDQTEPNNWYNPEYFILSKQYECIDEFLSKFFQIDSIDEYDIYKIDSPKWYEKIVMIGSTSYQKYIKKIDEQILRVNKEIEIYEKEITKKENQLLTKKDEKKCQQLGKELKKLLQNYESIKKILGELELKKHEIVEKNNNYPRVNNEVNLDLLKEITSDIQSPLSALAKTIADEFAPSGLKFSIKRFQMNLITSDEERSRDQKTSPTRKTNRYWWTCLENKSNLSMTIESL